jgi:phospholipase/lecithinase/hemolysin
VIPLVPHIPNDNAYYHGRFSNGPIWVDNLAKNMKVGLDDYAYGGAWIEPITVSKISMPINIGMQVNMFLVEAAADFNTSKHLYVLWAGGNDYLKGRSDAESATTNSVKILKDQIEWLRYYGAKNFLLLNLPDISMTPEVIGKGSAAVAEAQKITQMHNRKLEEMIKHEQAKHPHDKIILGDFTFYMDDIISNPMKYNLKNVTDACFGGGYWYNLSSAMDQREVDAALKAKIDIENNSSLREAYVVSRLAASGAQSCANPDEYLFWDHLHPTRAAHQIISTMTQLLLYINGINGRGEQVHDVQRNTIH